MFDFRFIKGLFLHILSDGDFGSIWISVLLLVGYFGSCYGIDGLCYVHTLLHECESLPFDNKLCKHDWICIKGELELIFSGIFTGLERV